MRIVGGRLKGAALLGPPSDATRPTSDRLRESLFNILVHGFDDPVAGARVLDLFAGTGALGFEALSRGAAFALFVEDAARVRGVIRGNAHNLGLVGLSRIWRRDATRLGPLTGQAPFDLVFCDPPYGRGLGAMALAAAAAGGWIGQGGLVVLEEARAAGPVEPAGLTLVDRREAGETALHFFRPA